MNIGMLARIAAWTIAFSLAAATSLGVVLLTRLLQQQSWGGVNNGPGFAGVAAMTALAIAPWWALAAAMVQWDRRRVRRDTDAVN